jgi:hypothetical protein
MVVVQKVDNVVVQFGAQCVLHDSRDVIGILHVENITSLQGQWRIRDLHRHSLRVKALPFNGFKETEGVDHIRT